jgi:hypothetical protein
MNRKLAITLVLLIMGSFMPQAWAQVSTQGKHYIDDKGAKIIFRGYNLQGKVPPFQTVMSPADLEPLERVGTNLLRFNFVWEAAEPMQGVYDEGYFDYYDRVINWAADQGMYVIIDFHNNAFSRYAANGCGSGFPQWAISPDNPIHQPKAQGECTFSLAMMEAMLTPENYKNWEDFMANRYGVRDRFFALTARLARKYENHPAVIGFDLNEPMVFQPFLKYDEDLVGYFYNTWHKFIQNLPVEDVPVVPEGNLARSKPVTASSVESGSTPAANAVDGNLGSRWASAFSSTAWLQVDLGEAYPISSVKITWEEAYARDYTIQGSLDGLTWLTFKTITNNTALLNNHTGLNGTARYIRMNATLRAPCCTSYGYSMYEMEVYGDTAANNNIQIVRQGVAPYITFLGDNPFQFITINKPPELHVPETGPVSLDAHFYEVGSHSFGVPLLSTEPNIDAIVATRDGYDIPVLVGEYGVNLKNGEKDVFQYQMDMVLRRFDKELLSSARWAYTPHWTTLKKDHYHDEDFSCFDNLKRIRNSCRPRANVQVLTGDLYFNNIVHRGETSNFNPLLPMLSKYNQYERTKIDLSWEHVPAQGETKIFASREVIFEGNDIDINTHGSDLWCEYDMDEKYILCSSPTPGKKRVTITELGDFGIASLPGLLGLGFVNPLFLILVVVIGLFRNNVIQAGLKKLKPQSRQWKVAMPVFFLTLGGCDAGFNLAEVNGPANVDIVYPTYEIYESPIPEGRRLAYTERRDPCAVYNPLRDPYFGDTHIHTARSLDATIQDTRVSPYEAYEFAKGKRLKIQPWVSDTVSARTLQIGRPLDFAMVSDHASFFGEIEICNDKNIDPMGYYGLTCSAFRANPDANFIPWNLKYFAAFEPSDKPIDRFNFCGPGGEDCLKAAIPVWQEMQNAANAAYDKTGDCSFTAFIGYEHSGSPKAENIHRNILFQNRNVPLQPLAYVDYSKPENLWKGLDKECTSDIGCNVLTIPHNSNVSGGRMFRRDKDNINQQDFDSEYVALRRKYEPLVEVYQHKGESECSRASADEFCQFEKFPYDSLTGDRFEGLLTQEPGKDSFIRWALTEGLNQENITGVNPFKYGMIAATDTHLGTPGATSETNAPGHGGAGGGNATNGLSDSIAFSGGGHAVVWAEENTREYLFDAMQRKETYGTSGPRMLVRMFGGWEFPPAMCDSVVYDANGEALKRGAFVQSGYDYGVPMGSDLQGKPVNATAPYFAIAATRDPGFNTDNPASDLYEAGNKLQRIQVIKGWVDASGNHRERIYDVAGGNNGASVDLNSCSVQGNGNDQLCAVWQDPDFNPALSAFYYARVIENPSCRWSWLQCNAYLEKTPFDSFEDACREEGLVDEGYQRCCLHDNVSDIYPNTFAKEQVGTYPAEVQERAWTSPIWYNAL